MPAPLSLNQIELSDLTTTSFGSVSFFPSKLSASTVIEPSYSVRVSRCESISQVIRRSWRSRVLPLAYCDGLRNTLIAPVSSSHFMMRSFGISLHNR
jgi:hypothetical protein